MTIVTPDVEAHVRARLIVLAPTVFKDGACFEGEERPLGGEVPLEATFVRWYGEKRDLHYDGQKRELFVQVLRRHARDGWTPQRRRDALAKLRTAYDALHLSGGWTAADGTVYSDMRVIDAPAELPSAYFAMNVSVWYAS